MAPPRRDCWNRARRTGNELNQSQLGKESAGGNSARTGHAKYRERAFMSYRISDRKCFILSCIVFASFLLLPFLPYAYGGLCSRILMLFYTALMIMAPYFFIRTRKLLWALVITGTVFFLIQVTGMFFVLPEPGMLHWSAVGWDVICLGIELFWVGYVLRSSILVREFREPVFGCVLAYMLMGTVFGNIFYSIESYFPGSFYSARDQILTHADMIYLSFIALSTCGFGDIVPVTSFARMLVVLETICGVMYVGLFVSRVVSEYHILAAVRAHAGTRAAEPAQTEPDSGPR